MSNAVVLQLCSQEEKTSRKAYCWKTFELPTLIPRVWAGTNLFWWPIKFITISVQALNQCAVPKLSATNLIEISPFSNDGVMHLHYRNLTAVGLFLFVERVLLFKVILKRLKPEQIITDEADRCGKSACVLVRRFGVGGKRQERFARFQRTQREDTHKKKKRVNVCCYWSKSCVKRPLYCNNPFLVGLFP